MKHVSRFIAGRNAQQNGATDDAIVPRAVHVDVIRSRAVLFGGGLVRRARVLACLGFKTHNDDDS